MSTDIELGEDQAPGKSLRVREYIEDLITSGLNPHERLPTERSLADSLKVNRNTIRQVLDSLEAEHRVYRVQGSGTYVADRHIDKSIRFTSFTQDMLDRGLHPGSRLLSFDRVPAGATIGARLKLSPAEDVFRFTRLRLADDEPMCLEIAHLHAAICPDLRTHDLTTSLYQILERHYRITLQTAQQRISATVLDPDQAVLLDVPPFSAALVVERTTCDQRGRLIEDAVSIYRADRYAFTLEISR